MTFIKICGVTDPETAKLCAELGASAIGCVFYEKSHRHLSVEKALAITSAVPETMLRVALMVDPDVDEAVFIAKNAGCNAIQLHGNESPQTALTLMEKGFQVIKAFYMHGSPSILSRKDFPKAAIPLVEASSGKLPGGNAKAWDWSSARIFSEKSPLILAGGLDPENISQALEKARPWGVDVSSGVESAPGVKDHEKIRRFIEKIREFDFKKSQDKTFGR